MVGAGKDVQGCEHNGTSQLSGRHTPRSTAHRERGGSTTICSKIYLGSAAQRKDTCSNNVTLFVLGKDGSDMDKRAL